MAEDSTYTFSLVIEKCVREDYVVLASSEEEAIRKGVHKGEELVSITRAEYPLNLGRLSRGT